MTEKDLDPVSYGVYNQMRVRMQDKICIDTQVWDYIYLSLYGGIYEQAYSRVWDHVRHQFGILHGKG